MMVRGFMPAPAPNDIVYSPLSVAVAVAEGLFNKGHDVTFFAPEGSQLQCTVETLRLQPAVTTFRGLNEFVSTTDLFEDYLPSLYDQRMVKAMFERAADGEFDVVIFNHPESSIAYASLFPEVPAVYILHDYLDEKRRLVFDMYPSKNQHFISISNSQRRDAPDLPYLDTVYNGVDIELFSYNEEAEDYLLFVGRIVPEKGVREAIQVAIRTNKQLIIIGQLPPTSYSYFDTHIKPYLSDKILYIGPIDKEQLSKYYQKAQALLMPIQWEEPFGLTMAEAMSCGTPVIAFNRGAAAEIVKDGKTGFIVDNTAKMIEAVDKIQMISRKDCRTHVEHHFTVNRMVSAYEKVLASIVPRGKQPKKSIFIKSVKRISGRFNQKLR